MRTIKEMKWNLKALGLSDAIEGEATVNGHPAIRLVWNGAEEYYTGRDMVIDADDSTIQYQKWLKETFK